MALGIIGVCLWGGVFYFMFYNKCTQDKKYDKILKKCVSVCGTCKEDELCNINTGICQSICQEKCKKGYKCNAKSR